MGTVNIKHGSNYHINAIDGVVKVEFTDGEKLFCQEITDSKVGDVKLVDYCEEKIILSDGKVLKRLRDVLTIE